MPSAEPVAAPSGRTGIGRDRRVVLALLALATAVLAVAAVSVGPMRLGAQETLASLGRIVLGRPEAVGTDQLIAAIRMPRVLVALVIGAGLGVAGAAMQAVFRNPLAEPGITGVSSGAATVAVLLIVSGTAAASSSVILPLGAFAGALATVLIVQTAGLGTARTSTSSLLLVGIALNAFLGAVISAVVANAADPEDARSAMFWLNGDLTGLTMADVRLVVIPVLIGVVGVAVHADSLNMLSLGDASAQAAGLDVRRTKHLVLGFAALATAAGVAVTGVISFVGLVVPHLVRLIWGSEHRFLLPASALGGAIFLTAADTIARLAFQPVVLQTGTVTALVGAPFLLVLVLRSVRQGSAA
jgi:iron complex transport system permease protein